MSRPVAPDSSSGWPGSRLTIESFSWSPDGQALVITARERDVPWVYLWFAGQWETKPA